MKLLKLVMRLS